MTISNCANFLLNRGAHKYKLLRRQAIVDSHFQPEPETEIKNPVNLVNPVQKAIKI
jgi:hypothetical protein